LTQHFTDVVVIHKRFAFEAFIGFIFTPFKYLTEKMKCCLHVMPPTLLTTEQDVLKNCCSGVLCSSTVTSYQVHDTSEACGIR
jgi:hypothetical protein